MNNDKNNCGAKTKSTGKPCQRTPAEGRERCYLHGGNQPRGKDHHNFRHGIYSKHAGESLQNILSELEEMPSEELLNADNELKLLQALIIESNALKEGSGDIDDLDTISKVIDRLVKAKQRAVALKIEEERLIPAEDVKLFLSFVESLLINRIDEAEAYELLDEMQTFQISEHATN